MPVVIRTKMTVAQIKNVSDTFARLAAALNAEAVAVEHSGFQELEVTNWDSVRRAMDYLQNFVAAVSSAHIESCKARGDFYVETEKPAKKPAKRPRKKRSSE